MSDEEIPEERFETWAVIELMGHRRLAGLVSEQHVAGTTLLRIDIPEGQPSVQLYGGSAIYCITPCTEDAARKVAALGQPKPVQAWELPAGTRDEVPY